MKSHFHLTERFAFAWTFTSHPSSGSHNGSTCMNRLAFTLRGSLLATAMASGSLCFMAEAHAADPAADKQPTSSRQAGLAVRGAYPCVSAALYCRDVAVGVRPEARIRLR